VYIAAQENIFQPAQKTENTEIRGTVHQKGTDIMTIKWKDK
jgi:hypothetical protein